MFYSRPYRGDVIRAAAVARSTTVANRSVTVTVLVAQTRFGQARSPIRWRGVRR
ncbi:MAG: hypothetical protein HC844_20975 [Tabrizicola sp.]|nr:hypothetical protein [Tabrizicola sp.]